MHPEYLSTKYALQAGAEQGLSLIPVQHHHAHIVSCLVDNKSDGPVIGVVFDGTGYGTDGTIWGGEWLLADWHSFQRIGHLEYVPLLGGTAAIKKPYRMALSYLYSLLGEDFSLEGLPINKVNPAELEVIKQQLKRGINSPLTSSAGRFFDAVSALAGVREEIDYEAQAAIELEMLAPDGRGVQLNAPTWKPYPFSIVEHQGTSLFNDPACHSDPERSEGEESRDPSLALRETTKRHQGMRVVKLAELFSAIVQDVENQVPVPIISLKFHNTVAHMIVEMCESIARETGITRVALSGGVFQNRLLLKLATATLQRAGFSVLTHHLVPCNDGGISLGQAVIANSTTS